MAVLGIGGVFVCVYSPMSSTVTLTIVNMSERSHIMREHFGNGIYIDWLDPKAGTGSALAEHYFRLADEAAERGDDAHADAYWQAGARASNFAAHPESTKESV